MGKNYGSILARYNDLKRIADEMTSVMNSELTSSLVYDSEGKYTEIRNNAVQALSNLNSNLATLQRKVNNLGIYESKI